MCYLSMQFDIVPDVKSTKDQLDVELGVLAGYFIMNIAQCLFWASDMKLLN